MDTDAAVTAQAPKTAEPTASSSLLGFAASYAWLTGAAGGLWLALADFGALWLWLPLWRDRSGLLLRLIATLLPLGAALGGLLWVCVATSLRWTRLGSHHRSERRLAVLWAAASAPALRLLAVKLCSGGMMIRLRHHDAIEWSATLALPVLLYFALVAAQRLARRVADDRVTALRVAGALLVTSFVLSKVNQTVLPNLYDYLHAALAFFSWLSSSLGLLLIAFFASRLHAMRVRLQQRWLRAAVLVTLLVGGAVNLLTLDSNLNVRVAMFDPRSPATRSLLSAAAPLLRTIEQRPTQPRVAARRRPESATLTGLAKAPGAHILLVTIDALRADHLGAYGYARPVSPHLDMLSRRGLMFQHAYAQAPHSSYSLSSLHTSEYIHEVVELPRPLPNATLASVLRDNGYHTAAFFTDGVFHTEGHKLAAYRDSAFGFALFDHTNRESEDQTDRVLAEVDRILEQGEPPSLLWVHYFDVHEPYQQTTFGSSDMDRYDSEILHVDRELKRLVDELDRRFSREVVIAISADHGEEFREHGGVYHGSTLFEEQVRVPMIFRHPGFVQQSVAAPVEVIDIAPTLLGMVGVEPAASMRGRDLRALAAGREAEQIPVFSAVLTKRMAVRWPLKLIADLRFGLFELYDLSTDPEERRNLAQQRPTELAALRADVYGWLDSLESAASDPAGSQEHPRARALRWGRLGDRRAVAPMGELLLDESAPTEQRAEAGQILAKLADESSADQLVRGLTTKPDSVAAEAAIALGRMYDVRARSALERLVHAEDPYLRARAAISLGRLRDVRAVPALIDALWVAPSLYEREEAVRWLGRLRDSSAVEPLISLIPEFGMRYLVAVALGQIGDPRAYEALADMMEWEEHANIRDEVVRGLGLLGDTRAIDLLLPVLAHETGLKNTAESLIRLGALEQERLGGVDVGPRTSRAQGLHDCVEGPLLHDWDYLQRTSCKAQRARLSLPVPARAELNRGAQLLVRMRKDEGAPCDASVTLAGRQLGTMRVDSEWREARLSVEPGALVARTVALEVACVEPGHVLALDHALLSPVAHPVGSRGPEAAQHP